mmetsp:Transcript_32674/g.52602  ORF Transcript_32674/g.52602 Transcript_32674/m.52602 type:complete len:91 (-) Transcript_32674:33-305(-)
MWSCPQDEKYTIDVRVHAEVEAIKSDPPRLPCFFFPLGYILARKVSRNGSAEKEAEIIEGGKGRDSKRARRLFGSLEGKSRWISPSWGHR